MVPLSCFTGRKLQILSLTAFTSMLYYAASGGKKLLVSCYHAEDAVFSIAAEGYTSCTLKAVRADYCEEACTSGETLTASDGRFVITHTGGSAVYLLEMGL